MVDHFERHPDEAPPVVRQSRVVLDEELRGTQTVRGLDLTGYRGVTLYLTCDADVDYRVVLGTAREPDGKAYGGTSCGGGVSGSYSVPVSPTDPFTQVTAQVGTGVGYCLTMYGEPVDAPVRDDG